MMELAHGYYLDESDPDLLALHAPDGLVLSYFVPDAVTMENIARVVEYDRQIHRGLPLDEMRDLARYVWDAGDHGEPATTLASYVLWLLDEPPFPEGREDIVSLGGTTSEDDKQGGWSR